MEARDALDDKWAEIAKRVGGRTGEQVRLRYFRHLDPSAPPPRQKNGAERRRHAHTSGMKIALSRHAMIRIYREMKFVDCKVRLCPCLPLSVSLSVSYAYVRIVTIFH